MDPSPKFKSPEKPSEEEMEVMSKRGSITVIVPGKMWEVKIPLIGLEPIVIRDSTSAGAAQKALAMFRIMEPFQKQL